MLYSTESKQALTFGKHSLYNVPCTRTLLREEMSNHFFFFFLIFFILTPFVVAEVGYVERKCNQNAPNIIQHECFQVKIDHVWGTVSKVPARMLGCFGVKIVPYEVLFGEKSFHLVPHGALSTWAYVQKKPVPVVQGTTQQINS